jgi:hypothetical protein
VFAFVLVLLLGVGFMAGASEGAVSINGSDTRQISVGETLTLSATITGATGTASWTIGNTNIVSATSGSSGNSFSIRGVSEGSSRVTCSAGGSSDSVMVYVGGDDYGYYEDYEEEGGGCAVFGLGVGLLALAALVLLRKKSRR